MNKNLDNYYDVALLCDDNIVIVSLLVQIVSLDVNSKILNDLENGKVDKYSNEFEKLLEMPPKVFKNLSELLMDNVIKFENKKMVKVVNKDTTLLDLMMEKD